MAVIELHGMAVWCISQQTLYRLLLVLFADVMQRSGLLQLSEEPKAPQVQPTIEEPYVLLSL